MIMETKIIKPFVFGKKKGFFVPCLEHHNVAMQALYDDKLTDFEKLACNYVVHGFSEGIAVAYGYLKVVDDYLNDKYHVDNEDSYQLVTYESYLTSLELSADNPYNKEIEEATMWIMYTFSNNMKVHKKYLEILKKY